MILPFWFGFSQKKSRGGGTSGCPWGRAARGASPPRATGRVAVPGVIPTSGTTPAGAPEVHHPPLQGPHGQKIISHPHVLAAIPRCGRPPPASGRPSPGVSGHPQLRDGHPHVVSAVATCEWPSPGVSGHPQAWPPIPMLTPRAQPPSPRCRGAAPCPSPTKIAPHRSHYAGSNYLKNTRPPPAPHGHQRANNRAVGGAP